MSNAKSVSVYTVVARDELITAGATRLRAGEDGAVVLADPDGNEFTVRRH